LSCAWEDYWLWKKEAKKKRELKWGKRVLFWDDFSDWLILPLKVEKVEVVEAGTLKDRASNLKPEKHKIKSDKKLFTNWCGFYEKWNKESFFDQSKVFSIGQSSFATVEQCENYQFLNQFIVSREEPETENTAGENFRGANLIGDDLEGADLAGADLRRAILIGANLEEADLKGAKFVGANLLTTNLARANLKGANLLRAKLTGADLTGANLVGAKFFKREILLANNWRKAFFDEDVMEKLEEMEERGRK
jgi:hypothetical protein